MYSVLTKAKERIAFGSESLPFLFMLKMKTGRWLKSCSQLCAVELHAIHSDMFWNVLLTLLFFFFFTSQIKIWIYQLMHPTTLTSILHGLLVPQVRVNFGMMSFFPKWFHDPLSYFNLIVSLLLILMIKLCQMCSFAIIIMPLLIVLFKPQMIICNLNKASLICWLSLQFN